MSWIKNILKRFLPPSIHILMRESDRLEDLITALQKTLEVLQNSLQEQTLAIQNLEKKLKQQEENYQELKRSYLTQNVQLLLDENKKAQQELLRRIDNSEENVRKAIEKNTEIFWPPMNSLSSRVSTTVRNSEEADWAEIFNNTISDSSWLKHKAFAPGRWAVGYPLLYAMYRVLDEYRPQSILELGLGQSTRMMAQYAKANPDVSHTVVEHDGEWIRLFQEQFALPENSRILQLELTSEEYKEAKSVRTYSGFEENFRGQKFDFILIDAPFGGDMKEYSRIDLLHLLPDCLGERFVIMMDDCERPGETHTAREIEQLLKRYGIEYERGFYNGKKDSVLFCDEKNRFLTTM